MWQDGGVRITVGSAQCARWRLELEPLDQGFVLRMVNDAVQHYGEGGVRQTFDYVAGLQDIPAIPVGREPEWRQIVDAVADHERVVVGLGDLVAKPGDVLETWSEQPRGDPTRVVQYPALLRIAARCKEVRVETQNATVSCVPEKDIHVGEQEGRNVFRCDDVVHDIGDYNARQTGFEREIRRVIVHQDIAATRSVRIERENIVAPGEIGAGRTGWGLPDMHGEGWLRSRPKQGMPVRLHLVEILGALDSVGKLRRVGTARICCIRKDR